MIIGKRVQMPLYLTPEQHTWLRERAFDRNQTRSRVVQDLIDAARAQTPSQAKGVNNESH